MATKYGGKNPSFCDWPWGEGGAGAAVYRNSLALAWVSANGKL